MLLTTGRCCGSSGRPAGLRETTDAFGSDVARELDRTEAGRRERPAVSARFVAEINGQASGPARDATPDQHARATVPGRRYLRSMWVHPAHRGAGVGARLMAAVRKWAVADGATEPAPWVVEGNARAAALRPCGLRTDRVATALPGRPGVGEEQWALQLR